METNYNPAYSLYKNSSDNPDKIALSVDNETYTYADLTSLAMKISAWIETFSLKRILRVGILARKSIDTIAGIMGTCWAGCIYVPLNPAWPKKRLAFLIKQSELNALIIDKSCINLLDDDISDIFPNHILSPMIKSNRNTNKDFVGTEFLEMMRTASVHPVFVLPDDIVYMMFTSGSTGTPKAVMVTAENVASMLQSVHKHFQFTDKDRFAQLADITFDQSVLEIFMTFFSGGGLHVIPPNQVMAPVKFIRDNELTVWISVPSIAGFMKKMNMLKPGVFPSLRISIFGGEALPATLARTWQKAAPNSIIENAYGPTEATVMCMSQKFKEDDTSCLTPTLENVAIGQPVGDTKVAIVDSNGQFTNIPGLNGELAISGPQVTAGYWQDEMLTKKRYLLRENSEHKKEVWYLTGDLVCKDKNGTFHFLGRVDNQVKVLGNRIETEEIETWLRKAAGCDTVAVIAWPIKDGSATHITGFVNGNINDIPTINRYLKEHLPPYMVPEKIIELDTLPLDTSGKVSKSTLISMLKNKQCPDFA